MEQGEANKETMSGVPDRIATLTLRVLGVTLLCSLPCSAQDVATIIQRSVEANSRDWAAAPEFDNYERDRDKNGDKTYAVTMLFGSPYRRLVAVNGSPLRPAQQKEEEKKYQNAVAQREHESPEQRKERIGKYEAERKRDQTLLAEITKAFDFRLLGTHSLNGRQVYVLKATPRKDYRPPNRDSSVLTGMEGTLWIDHDTFQWLKVEAHVIRPVSIIGFLAKVEPGTRFELEKMPVSNGVWLAKHFTMTSNARVAFIFRRRSQEDDTYFNYHKKTEPASEERSAVPGDRPEKMSNERQ
jgi:hypothetical protein